MYQNLIKDLNRFANPKKAKILAGFFKTGKGEYGEGDVFLGITVPEQRKVAEKYTNISFSELKRVLKSKIHEHRLVALIILVDKYEKALTNNNFQKKIVDFYLKNLKYVNNWDLVDLSAPSILGDYLFDKNKTKLYNLAKSKSLWERRISIVSTLGFIKNKKYLDTLLISKILISDFEDLIHKATGWMLREVGKRDVSVLKKFLNQFAHKMPRTMLRYSIEKFSAVERKKYLNKK